MKVEVEREEDGRWLAEVPTIPGALVYGTSRTEAISRVEALVLRVLADKRGGPRFLILGSASKELLRQSSESLAGRIVYHELPALSQREVGPKEYERLWVRGGFPRSFTAKTEPKSFAWRESFIQTFVERDAPQLGVGIPAVTLRRFWSMLAHVHGQTLNYSDLARSRRAPSGQG